MTESDRKRAIALGRIFAEDVALAMNCAVTELSSEWLNWAEASAMFVFATGDLERMAATGAMIHTAAQLP